MRSRTTTLSGNTRGTVRRPSALILAFDPKRPRAARPASSSGVAAGASTLDVLEAGFPTLAKHRPDLLKAIEHCVATALAEIGERGDAR